MKLVEAVRKPGSVPGSGYPSPGDGHSSGSTVTGNLKQPTRRHGRATLNAPLFGLAPDGVYLASDVTIRPGELLPHPFTLTCRGRRTSLCGTYPWGHPRWTLSSVTPYGARTFLHRTSRQRPSGLLQPNPLPHEHPSTPFRVHVPPLLLLQLEDQDPLAMRAGQDFLVFVQIVVELWRQVHIASHAIPVTGDGKSLTATLFP